VDTVRLIDPGRGAAAQKPPATGYVEPEPRERGRRPREATRSPDFRLPARDLSQIPPPSR